MPRYIAYLRAINVGGRVVKMEVLRQIFESLGYSNVETFIASGNIIFESPVKEPATLERQIEAELKAKLGYEVKTLIRTPHEIAEVAKYQPFPAEEIEKPEHSLYVAFLADKPETEHIEKLLELQNEIEAFRVHGREMYWLCRVKSSESKFTNNRLEKLLKTAATMRNITTVKKMVAKYSESTPN